MKKLLALILVLAMVLGLAACGSTGNSSDASTAPAKSQPAASGEPAKSDEPITLEFWCMTDDVERYEAIIAAYTAEHPNITINMTHQSSSEIDQAQTTALAGREKIDCFVSNGSQYLEGRISTGMAEPLNAYMEASGFDESIYSEAFKDTAVNGQYYGIPYRDSVNLIIYNKTYFDERGVDYPNADTTWTELLDIAEKMTWGEGPDKVYGLFNAARNTDWNDIATTHNVFSTSEDLTLLKEAMEWKLDAVNRGVMLDNASYTAFGTGIRAMFASGKSSMYFGGDWTIGQLTGDYKKGVFDFEWDVAPMPKMEDGSGRMVVPGQFVYASVCSYSEHKQEAYDFIEYLGGHEGAKIGASFGMMPAAKYFDDVKEAFYSFPADVGMPASINLFFDLETTQPPIVKGYAQVEALVKQEADLVFSGMQTVDEAIEHIYTQREAFMK